MGSFIANLHVRADDDQGIADALSGLGSKDFRVAPAHGGWVSVVEQRASDQDTEWLAAAVERLSAVLHRVVVGFLVHDSDVLCYWLFDDGREVDVFNSCPDYFEEGGGSEPEGGDSEALLAYCVPGTAIETVDEVLAMEPTFADDQLVRLAVLLGIEPDRALADFKDAADGEGSGDLEELLGGLDSRGGGVGGPGGLGGAAGLGGAVDLLRAQLERAFPPPPASDDAGTDGLIEAASRGDLGAIRAAVAGGVPVDGVGPWAIPVPGLSSLGGALAGAMPAMPKVPVTPLVAAVASRQPAAVELLVSLGARLDLELPPRFGRALHTAASMALPDVIRVLLAAGADPNATRSNGASALQELQTSRRLLSQFDALRSMLPPEVRNTIPDAGVYDTCERLLREAGAR